MTLVFIGIILLLGLIGWLLVLAIAAESGMRRTATAGRRQADGQALPMEEAARALYDFLAQLGRNPRCLDELRALPGLDDFAHAEFSIAPKLAAIALCDARDCYCQLGNSLSNLSATAGMGFLMFVALLFDGDASIAFLRDPQKRQGFAKSVSKLTPETVDIAVNGGGMEKEFRFGIIFGLMNNEFDWVQRYSTLMYRWASLMAKADGVVTAREGEVLARIMKMREFKNEGNVHVSGYGDESAAVAPWRPGGGAAAPRNRDAAAPGQSGAAGNLNEVLSGLDALVGLAPVKREVRKLVSFIQIQKKRKENGLKAAPVSYHCVFTGNPGTGKTTVARIIADVYRELGVVKRGHLVETDRSGLIGEYVGQTAVKTNKIVDATLDGVLFIDEAYSLVQGGQNDYGREAIATLIKRMEDDRERLVVILAGYTDEMRAFIESNPGLRSRFNRYIDFPDYSAAELSAIFLSLAAKSDYRCDDDVRASITDVMERAIRGKDRTFGNARYVRNLFESAIERQAVRLSSVPSVTPGMLQELTLHDLGFKYEDDAGGSPA